ncbi:hypothetical protein MAH1_05930 [Sessilibacter sp. MAH1]
MKVFVRLFVLILVFSIGYVTASWQFVNGSRFLLNEPIEIMVDGENGRLPKGTELHYQSMAHNEVDFYVFVRIPKEKAMLKTSRVNIDIENGIKRLRGDFE